MTSEDAISVILANGMLYAPKNEPTATMIQDAFDMAIKALEKQMPRKVIRSIYHVRFCPICNGSVWQNRDESKYCFRCGQALDWSVDELSKPKGKRMFTDEQIERICWEIERINKEQREKEND